MLERARRGHRHTGGGGSTPLPGVVLGGALAVALTAAVAAMALALHGRTAPAFAASSGGAPPRARTTDPTGQLSRFDPSPLAPPAAAALSPALTQAPTPGPSPARGRGVAEGRGEGSTDGPRHVAEAGPAPPSAALPAGQAPAEAPGALVLAEPLPTPSSALSAAPPPLEREHQVRPGETLTSIAQRYGITPDTIVMNNAGVTDRDLLKVGQTLRIPPRDGLLYELRWGETLTGVAERFGVEVTAIVQEPANRITAPDLVREGQVVFLPGAKLSPPPARPLAADLRPTEAGGAAAVSGPGVTPGRGAGASAPAPALAPAQARPAGGGWLWPITGPISSYFGPSHPLGIDIDLYGRAGAPIVAARAGVVTFAGGNPCCSYGYYVEIDHGDGFRTLYAHLNAPPPVRIGQRVGQGQVVGYAGTTGYSTGVHLHFEVRRNGVPVNPLAFLP
jgi:murein DD-endopeptidase MepM/ murein hydrolase activator NlpD